MGCQPDPQVGHHIHRTISSSNLDSRTVLVTSKTTRILSHASLATSVVEIILNQVRSTQLKIAFRAREYWVDRASSSGVQSASLLGIVFPSTLILVGSFHPCRIDLYALSSIDFMKARILPFQ